MNVQYLQHFLSLSFIDLHLQAFKRGDYGQVTGLAKLENYCVLSSIILANKEEVSWNLSAVDFELSWSSFLSTSNNTWLKIYDEESDKAQVGCELLSITIKIKHVETVHTCHDISESTYKGEPHEAQYSSKILDTLTC